MQPELLCSLKTLNFDSTMLKRGHWHKRDSISKFLAVATQCAAARYVGLVAQIVRGRTDGKFALYAAAHLVVRPHDRSSLVFERFLSNSNNSKCNKLIYDGK